MKRTPAFVLFLAGSLLLVSAAASANTKFPPTESANSSKCTRLMITMVKDKWDDLEELAENNGYTTSEVVEASKLYPEKSYTLSPSFMTAHMTLAYQGDSTGPAFPGNLQEATDLSKKVQFLFNSKKTSQFTNISCAPFKAVALSSYPFAVQLVHCVGLSICK